MFRRCIARPPSSNRQYWQMGLGVPHDSVSSPHLSHLAMALRLNWLHVSLN
jgi:hypothetical protein